MRKTLIFALFTVAVLILFADTGNAYRDYCKPNRPEYYPDCTNVLKKYLQPDDVGFNTNYDNLNRSNPYLCARDCTKYPQRRLCYYQFTLEQYNSMGPACDSCWSGKNPTDCFNPQCVPGDGIEKTVLVINRRFPGPWIQVCYNDEIIIDVHNHMPAREIAIHWHGIRQLETPYMDGVPLITQCSINEGASFRYHFLADTPGTHFYHSHSAFHEFEGMSGVLIVRAPKKYDLVKNYYDFDLFSHILHIADWMHVMEDNKYPGANRNASLITQKADSYLINGLGTFLLPDGTYTHSPIAKFVLKPGKRHRFRIIAATSHTCTVRVTFEKHRMTLISTDGYDCQPVVARTIFIRAGELHDVVIHANQSPGCYVIRVQGINECDQAVQYGVMCYEGSSDLAKSNPPFKGILFSNEEKYYKRTTEALFNQLFGNLKFPLLNEVRGGCINDPDSICMDEVRSFQRAPEPILAKNPTVRYFLELRSFLFTIQRLYRSGTYHRHYIPFAGPTYPGLPGGVVNDNINNKTNYFPPSPFYTSQPPKDLECPKTCKDMCECFHYLKVVHNSVVELVITDDISIKGLFEMDHPMHLHGHHFWVLKQGTREERAKPNYYLNTVINKNTCGKSCTDRPNHRDIVSVPAAGFTVIRFQATNIGVWNFHCHFALHNHNGMSVIFQVGDRRQFKPVPPGFPSTCGDFMPPTNPRLGRCKAR